MTSLLRMSDAELAKAEAGSGFRAGPALAVSAVSSVLALTGSRSEIQARPLPEDDPKVRRPDITVARDVLGWEPQVPLEEGLRRTIPYFQAHPGPAK